VSAEATVSCSQFNWQTGDTLEGQEDCLLLNVYTPVNSTMPDTPLPVMVWIHGGGLTSGSDQYRRYGPQHFMDRLILFLFFKFVCRDVVVVTINYRLGPFGFLYLGTEQVKGVGWQGTKYHNWYIGILVFDRYRATPG
jgi:para-nitrobenzyl esterase